jgi:hypothetical protein
MVIHMHQTSLQALISHTHTLYNCVLYSISHALCGRGQFWIVHSCAWAARAEWVERVTVMLSSTSHVFRDGHQRTRCDLRRVAACCTYHTLLVNAHDLS